RCYVEPGLLREVTQAGEPVATVMATDEDYEQPNITPYIDVFFYDGPISRSMGFDNLLGSSTDLANRLGLAIQGDDRPAQLISVATDGETFGHHKGGTEKCLAYAFTQEFLQRGWQLTNFAHYLSLNPPAWEVVLKPVTAWSCSHGVDRWQSACGCGGSDDTQQEWRRPLRDALDWLRDQLSDVFETEASPLFTDPWQARDAFIQVILNRQPSNVEAFLQQQQSHPLTESEQVDALRLLEMQRHTLLMYTSCGWFFEEISRPEGTQILRYAGRAIALVAEITGQSLEAEFKQRLAIAPSNVSLYKDGADLYEQLVQTQRLGIDQLAAQAVIQSFFSHYDSNNHETSQESNRKSGYELTPQLNSSLASPFVPTIAETVTGPSVTKLYCYSVYHLDQQMQRLGALTLAVGHLHIVSDLTWESRHLMFAILHLGGWDFHCQVQPFSSRLDYTTLKEGIFTSLRHGSAAQTILTMQDYFPNARTYSLQDLFVEDRHVLMQQLTAHTLRRLDQTYTQVYRDNYGILLAFHRDGFPVPDELQVAAEVSLKQRLTDVVHTIEQSCFVLGQRLSQIEAAPWLELAALAAEAAQIRYEFIAPDTRQTIERLLWRSLWQFLYEHDAIQADADLEALQRLLTLGRELKLSPGIERLQELYYLYLQNQTQDSAQDRVAVAGPGMVSASLSPSSQGAIATQHLFNLSTLLEFKLG
ncbi:MAG: DUF3536 domain-containing protein, partial [Cyanobacteria bacterium P01_H01_bin.121]